MTDQMIKEMADAAATNYEFSCDWRRARVAANEYCREIFRRIPRKRELDAAIAQAKLAW